MTDLSLGPREQRYRCYFLHRRYVVALLVRGAVVESIDGVPEDAQLVGMTWSEEQGGMLVSLFHHSFDALDQNTSTRPLVARVKVTRAQWADVRGITLRDALDSVQPVDDPPTPAVEAELPWHTSHVLASWGRQCVRCGTAEGETAGRVAVCRPPGRPAWHASHVLVAHATASGDYALTCGECGAREPVASPCVGRVAWPERAAEAVAHASHPGWPGGRCEACGLSLADAASAIPCTGRWPDDEDDVVEAGGAWPERDGPSEPDQTQPSALALQRAVEHEPYRVGTNEARPLALRAGWHESHRIFVRTRDGDTQCHDCGLQMTADESRALAGRPSVPPSWPTAQPCVARPHVPVTSGAFVVPLSMEAEQRPSWLRRALRMLHEAMPGRDA